MTLAEDFPRMDTVAICGVLLGKSKELRDAELTLQWLYMEEDGRVQECPPRAGIDIRRDIRKQRTRLGWLRKTLGEGRQ